MSVPQVLRLFLSLLPHTLFRLLIYKGKVWHYIHSINWQRHRRHQEKGSPEMVDISWEKTRLVMSLPLRHFLQLLINILLYPLICICYVMYYYLIHCIEAKVQFYHFSDARNQTMSPLPWFSTDSEFIHETMPLLKVEWYYSLLWIYKKMLCLVTLPTRAEEAVVPFIYSLKEENWARCLKLSNFGMSCMDTS